MSYFDNGFNCAESTLLAIAKDAMMLMLNSDLIPRIATGFVVGFQGRDASVEISGACHGVRFEAWQKESRTVYSKNVQEGGEVLQSFKRSSEAYFVRNCPDAIFPP